MAEMLTIEIVASVFGVMSVYLYIARHQAAWPVGLIQVILFIFVFADAKLYADMILHGAYAVLQLYGWWKWIQLENAAGFSGGKQQESIGESPFRAQRLGLIGWLWGLAATTGMTVLFTSMLGRYTDASYPLPDSFIAATSIVAQLLLARKYIDNWLYWIIVDLVAIALFGYKGLVFTTVLYAVFLGMAIWGYRAWRTQTQLLQRCVGENEKLEATSMSGSH